jgi:hypothetical protein
MKAHFSIRVDVPRSLVVITMAGFFAPADIARFVAARNDAHRLLTCGANQQVTLIDIRAMDIQAQDSVAAFRAVLVDPARASRRLAFVVPQSLARMQIQRAADSRAAHYFGSPEDAEHWLMAPDSDPDPAPASTATQAAPAAPAVSAAASRADAALPA